MQSKKQSFIESCASIAIGYIVALISQIIIFPMFGIYITIEDNLAITAWFTLVSFIRSYFVRRLFNKLHSLEITK